MALAIQQPALHLREEVAKQSTHHHDDDYVGLSNYTGKNLIINGNQKETQRSTDDFATPVTVTGDSYVQDRWRNNKANNTATAQKLTAKSPTNSDVMRLAVTAQTGIGYLQWVSELENFEQLAGKIVTLTIETRANKPISLYFSYTGRLHKSEVHPGDGNWHTISMTVKLPEDISGHLTFQNSTYNDGATAQAVGDYLDIGNAQLEVGDTFTGFEVVDPAINLARCQRYCQEIIPYATSGLDKAWGTGVTGNTSELFGAFYLPVPMRDIPTATVVGSPVAFDGAANVTLTGFTILDRTERSFVFYSFQSAAFTANAAYAIKNGTSILLDAEL